MKTGDAGLCDVFRDVAVVLFAGGGGCHDAFDKAASLCAVRAKTPFAPLDGRAHGPFRGVVRRLHAFDIHKGPQILRIVDNALARAFHLLVATLRPFAQEFLDICAQPPLGPSTFRSDPAAPQ